MKPPPRQGAGRSPACQALPPSAAAFRVRLPAFSWWECRSSVPQPRQSVQAARPRRPKPPPRGPRPRSRISPDPGCGHIATHPPYRNRLHAWPAPTRRGRGPTALLGHGLVPSCRALTAIWPSFPTTALGDQPVPFPTVPTDPWTPHHPLSSAPRLQSEAAESGGPTGPALPACCPLPSAIGWRPRPQGQSPYRAGSGR